MRYFNNLPLVATTDVNNNAILVNNLLSRNYFLPDLLKNYVLFYDYQIKEGDTPENIAYRYYGDVYSYWMVLYANNIIDQESQWPLTSQQFELYLNDKYATVSGNNAIAYTLSTVHHYEKIIYTGSSEEPSQQSITINIDKSTYDSLQDSDNEKVVSGIKYFTRIRKNAVSIYDYELGVNESKRNINLLKKEYASDAEKQFQDLMSQ